MRVDLESWHIAREHLDWCKAQRMSPLDVIRSVGMYARDGADWVDARLAIARDHMRIKITEEGMRRG